MTDQKTTSPRPTANRTTLAQGGLNSFYKHPTQLLNGRNGQVENGKKTCHHGSLRHGISYFRENSVFHISRHPG